VLALHHNLELQSVSAGSHPHHSCPRLFLLLAYNSNLLGAFLSKRRPALRLHNNLSLIEVHNQCSILDLVPSAGKNETKEGPIELERSVFWDLLSGLGCSARYKLESLLEELLHKEISAGEE
jgi:hypothetical protein